MAKGREDGIVIKNLKIQKEVTFHACRPKTTGPQFSLLLCCHGTGRARAGCEQSLIKEHNNQKGLSFMATAATATTKPRTEAMATVTATSSQVQDNRRDLDLGLGQTTKIKEERATNVRFSFEERKQQIKLTLFAIASLLLLIVASWRKQEGAPAGPGGPDGMHYTHPAET